MDSTRWDGVPKDFSSLEKKQDTQGSVDQLVQEIVDKVVAALEQSTDYFLEEKEHTLFLKIPSRTALRAINVALHKRGVTLDPSSFIPHRGLLSSQTGFLLKKISQK